nr:importin-5-like [Tanacetum cinerariifolium]
MMVENPQAEQLIKENEMRITSPGMMLMIVSAHEMVQQYNMYSKSTRMKLTNPYNKRDLHMEVKEFHANLLFISFVPWKTLEEGTRYVAIEFVIKLAEASWLRAFGMMRRSPQFFSRLFRIFLRMLFDIEDEVAWHTTKNEDLGE